MSDPSSFRASPDGIPEILKSPGATLDYSIDWLAGGWLQTGEQIASADWEIPAGLIKESAAIVGGAATVWISDGVVETDYVLSATITTNQGRTDTRSIRLLCRAR